MSIEQNKLAARRWFTDIIAQRQFEVADELFAANHITHDPHAPPQGWPMGPEGLKMVAGIFGGAFGDWNIGIEDQIAEGDKVVTRWRARAVHTGPLPGIAPTGRPVDVTGVNIARFENGKIVESWFNFDMLTLLQQVGGIPTPEHTH